MDCPYCGSWNITCDYYEDELIYFCLACDREVIIDDESYQDELSGNVPCPEGEYRPDKIPSVPRS